MLKRFLFGAVALAALLPGGASAQGQQQADQVTLYDRGSFKGRRITLEGPTRLYAPFATKSVELPEGRAWELCSGNSFTGCREFNASSKGTVMNVRSARPIAPVITAVPPGAPAAAVSAVGGGPWPSLRGLGSEYFVAPDRGGNRIEVPGGKAEDAQRAAEDFCLSRGWRTSAHDRLQSLGGRTYLADVLCAETRK